MYSGGVLLLCCERDAPAERCRVRRSPPVVVGPRGMAEPSIEAPVPWMIALFGALFEPVFADGIEARFEPRY